MFHINFHERIKSRIMVPKYYKVNHFLLKLLYYSVHIFLIFKYHVCYKYMSFVNRKAIYWSEIFDIMPKIFHGLLFHSFCDTPFTICSVCKRRSSLHRPHLETVEPETVTKLVVKVSNENVKEQFSSERPQLALTN